MYDPLQIDWASPSVAAALAALGLRLPNSVQSARAAGGVRGGAGSVGRSSGPRRSLRAGEPDHGSILQPVIDHVSRIAQEARPGSRSPQALGVARGRAQIGSSAEGRYSEDGQVPTNTPPAPKEPEAYWQPNWPLSESETGWRRNGSYTPEEVITRAKRALRFYDIFLKRKYSPDMAAALAANIEAESGGNYRQRQNPRHPGGPPGPGYGLIQWEPDRQARFLESFGYPIQQASEEDQLDFIAIELAKPAYEYGSGRRVARERGAGPQAAAIMNYYERPHERTKAAIDRANLADAIRRSDPRPSPAIDPTSPQDRAPRRMGR